MATTLEDRKMEAKETTDRHITSCQEVQTQLENKLRNLTNLQKKIRQENSRIENEVLSKMVNVISLNNRMLNELHLTRDVLLSVRGANFNNNGVENVNGSFDDGTEDDTSGENDSPLDELEEWTQHTSENVRRTKEKIDTLVDVLNSKTESSEEEDDLIVP